VAVLPGLQIAVHFSIPFNPNSKIDERWHRTIEEQFGACFDTYCGGQKDDRFRLAWKLAHDHPERCPTIAEVREKFERWLVGYHATPHSGEGMEGLSPAAAFGRFDPIPRSVLPEGALDLLILRVHNPEVQTAGGTRRGVHVTKDGVRYQGVQYGSADPRLWDLHGEWLPIRVHPEDASFVIICDREGRPLIRATNNRLALAGATREDVSDGIKTQKRARRYARQIREGALAPLNQSVVDAAIAARVASGQAAMQKLMAATGTGGPEPAAVRNIAPLRSDFVESCEAFQQRIDRPPADPPRRSLEEIAAHFRREDRAEPARPRRDLDEILGEGGVA